MSQSTRILTATAIIIGVLLTSTFLFWQFPYLSSTFLSLTNHRHTASLGPQVPLPDVLKHQQQHDGYSYDRPYDQHQDWTSDDNGGDYLLGVGKADITGPVVEINMMGYADPDQIGSGLRQRLYCRAFIVATKDLTPASWSEAKDIDSELTEDTDGASKRLIYLVLDTQSGDTAIRHGILSGLADLGPEYSRYYNKDNVAITGTHSHAGPGGWLNYLLPQITSKGFDQGSYRAIVDGSLLAIQRAHENIAPGYIRIGAVEVEEANINRSPYAYDANPKEEKARYSSNVDKTMTLLRFDRAEDQKPMGSLTWFAVHGTSLYGNNTVISGDNKGVAAYLFERHMSSINPDFVAGFSQSNVGDHSPRILGAFCDDTGLPCRYNDSTCADNRIDTCHGRGPYFNVADEGTKSCFEIGRRQFISAKSLFGGDGLSSQLVRLPSAEQRSSISSLHSFVNLSCYAFPSPFYPSKERRTCSAALGHSFASGTTDGPGRFDFRQGTTNDSSSPSTRNPLWKLARGFVHEPDEAQIKCQSPKPILLDVGAAENPYAWSPDIVDIQLLRIADLVIIITPGEATTMSGRRWREAIASAAKDVLDIPNPIVVLGGPANTYAHYIATEEEYRVQRYEGASTLHGPHTLEAYINLTLTYLPHLATGKQTHLGDLDPGPNPPINTNTSLSFISPVLFDNTPLFKSFGDVVSSPKPPPQHPAFFLPGDTVSTRFVGANPRNNFRLEGTFAAVEKKQDGGLWEVVRTDADWHLVFRWERTSTILGMSEVTVEWEIEDYEHDDDDNESVFGHEVETGIYRLRYFGDAKSITGYITPFEGTGEEFWIAGKGAV